MLLKKNSPKDLMLRGFDRDTILDRTGTDIGYHGAALRMEARGIDRFQYRVAHVQKRYGKAAIETALESYAAGALKPDVLASLGLGSGSAMSLRIFFTSLGYAAEFRAANGRARHHHSSEGVKAKYGVDNPFALKSVQAQSVATRRKKYGADYTFSKGSTLAEQARESRARTVAMKKQLESTKESA